MKTHNYKPISCADYDIYEIAILQRRQLRLCWHHAGWHQATLQPLDLVTRNGEEFLVCSAPSTLASHWIRLDAITDVQPL